jgi:hypothetical protein
MLIVGRVAELDSLGTLEVSGPFALRDFRPSDASAVDALIVKAFHQYCEQYSIRRPSRLPRANGSER